MQSPTLQTSAFVPAVTRREVLRAGSLSLMGLSLPELLAGREASAGVAHAPSFGKAKACILLFMWGGPAHQDTWDLKPDAPAEIRGEFRPISTNVPGLDICEHLPLLAQRCDKLALIRSMTHTDVNHLTATHYLLTGQPPLPAGTRDTDWPHLGAVLAKLGRSEGALAPYVSMRPKMPGDVPRFVEQSRGQFAGWLGRAFDPFTIDARPDEADYRVGDFTLPPEVSVDRLERRRQLLGSIERQRAVLSQTADLDSLTRSYRKAFQLLHSGTGGDAFDLEQELGKLRERYGLNPHGQSVLQARRLVEHGVPLVTVYWPNEGIKNVSVYWDTHRRNFIDHRERLMPPARPGVFCPAGRSANARDLGRNAGDLDRRVRPHTARRTAQQRCRSRQRWPRPLAWLLHQRVGRGWHSRRRGAWCLGQTCRLSRAGSGSPHGPDRHGLPLLGRSTRSGIEGQPRAAHGCLSRQPSGRGSHLR